MTTFRTMERVELCGRYVYQAAVEVFLRSVRIACWSAGFFFFILECFLLVVTLESKVLERDRIARRRKG